MNRFDWQPGFAIGHERIDLEHRIFLDLIRDVAQRAVGARSRPLAANLLRELEKYAVFHFFSEENAMREVDYPDLAEHSAQHRQLLNDLNTCIWRFQNNDSTVGDVLEFLFTWFCRHTVEVDRRIVPYLKAGRDESPPAETPGR